jgi:hypothetical protein
MMNLKTEIILSKPLKRVGIAADHGGFELKDGKITRRRF